MRWLLVKDLLVLRRSQLLVALLVLYPIGVSVLVGVALSRGPDKPAVAFLNQVDPSENEISLGGEQVDVSRYADTLFQAVDPVRVATRAEALERVRDGDVLAALIIPPDVTQKLETGLEPATIEVLYNAEDPVKAAYVQDTIKAQVQDANLALSQAFTDVAVDYLGLIAGGGEVSLLGRTVNVLGLEEAERVLAEVRAGLPERDQRRVDDVIRFARLARENLNLADDVLASVGSPIRVEARVVEGGRTPLGDFAVAVAVSLSLMFVTVLLAAGTLALEREENAYPRLVRGLVSPVALVAEKVLLSAACSLVVALLMLAGLALFVDLDWSRFPLWVAALAPSALAFAAMGTALAALARDVRAASLLAFMVSLPIAFLALVPSGAVAAGLHDAIRVVSWLFPFDAALRAVESALSGVTGLLPAMARLAALAALFGALARVGLRRLAN